MGCAVGRTSFDLSATFRRVVGLDFSFSFVRAAQQLAARGRAEYTMAVEGDVTSAHVATLPPTAQPERCAFVQGDACNLPSNSAMAALGAAGGRFSVIHGANLICRLPEPRDFLRRLPSLLIPGGIVVLVSPFSWLKQYTPREKWIGEWGRGESGGLPAAGLCAHGGTHPARARARALITPPRHTPNTTPHPTPPQAVV